MGWDGRRVSIDGPGLVEVGSRRMRRMGRLGWSGKLWCGCRWVMLIGWIRGGYQTPGYAIGRMLTRCLTVVGFGLPFGIAVWQTSKNAA